MAAMVGAAVQPGVQVVGIGVSFSGNIGSSIYASSSENQGTQEADATCQACNSS